MMRWIETERGKGGEKEREISTIQEDRLLPCRMGVGTRGTVLLTCPVQLIILPSRRCSNNNNSSSRQPDCPPSPPIQLPSLTDATLRPSITGTPLLQLPHQLRTATATATARLPPPMPMWWWPDIIADIQPSTVVTVTVHRRRPRR